MMLAIVRSPKPVIAAVNGIATAAGLPARRELRSRRGKRGRALRHAWREYRAVLLHAHGRAQPQCVAQGRHGDAAARRHGRRRTEAEALGLVNRVVEPDETVNAAVELGRKIAEKPKATLKIGKEAFYRQLEMPLDEAYAYASTVMVENMLHAEAEEGIGAFLEKRQPSWPR